MGRPKKYDNFGFKNYFKLISSFFLHPKSYPSLIIRYPKVENGLFFLLINLSLGLVVKTLGDIFFYKSALVVFLTVTEMVFWLPVIFILFLIIGTLLHLIAKALKGRANLLESIKTLAFCSPVLIFFWIPFIRIFLFAFLVYCLILSFQRIHQYSLAKAIFNILAPFLLFGLLITMLGISNPVFFAA
ncbi:YIP1 family protein [Candidatus Daviesbacteria bacterium]|nr:YIP1 family protein [Candidatus Daviesbacteria bacterium]